MYSSFMVLILTLLCLHSAVLVNAALFVLEPLNCHGGQLCRVSWVDDGVKPLLSAIGVTKIGLYHGQQQLVQTIAPVDVAKTDSITFTPLRAAGPNSDAYYIAFTSTKFIGNDSLPYTGYSSFFSLTGMSGSFDSPLPAATSSIPIANSSTSSGTRTITVGTLSRSSSPLRTTATSSVTSISAHSTSTKPASTSTSISTSATSSRVPTASAGANGGTRHLPGPLSVLFLAIFSTAFFFS